MGSSRRARQPSPIKPWQWAELALLLVVMWAQLVLQFLAHAELVAAVLGVLVLGLLVHLYSWMWPLLREQRARRRRGRSD